jgi:hypothetical protein
MLTAMFSRKLGAMRRTTVMETESALLLSNMKDIRRDRVRHSPIMITVDIHFVILTIHSGL